MNGLLRILRSSMYLLFPVFIFSSCNNSSNKNNSDTTPQADTVHVSKNTGPPMDTVLIKDMKFVPAEIKVHKGDMVVWFNQDMVAHCVTEVNNKWASGSIAASDSWGRKAESSSDYYCAIHKVMKGKITVVE